MYIYIYIERDIYIYIYICIVTGLLFNVGGPHGDARRQLPEGQPALPPRNIICSIICYNISYIYTINTYNNSINYIIL